MAKNIKVSTTEKFISSFSGSVPVGTIVETLGYTTEGDGGGASWKKTATTGTASKSPAQLGNALLNDAGGNEWVLASKICDVKMTGSADGVDSKLSLQAAFNSLLPIYVSAGTYLASDVTIPNTCISVDWDIGAWVKANADGAYCVLVDGYKATGGEESGTRFNINRIQVTGNKRAYANLKGVGLYFVLRSEVEHIEADLFFNTGVDFIETVKESNFGTIRTKRCGTTLGLNSYSAAVDITQRSNIAGDAHNNITIENMQGVYNRGPDLRIDSDIDTAPVPRKININNYFLHGNIPTSDNPIPNVLTTPEKDDRLIIDIGKCEDVFFGTGSAVFGGNLVPLIRIEDGLFGSPTNVTFDNVLIGARYSKFGTPTNSHGIQQSSGRLNIKNFVAQSQFTGFNAINSLGGECNVDFSFVSIETGGVLITNTAEVKLYNTDVDFSGRKLSGVSQYIGNNGSATTREGVSGSDLTASEIKYLATANRGIISTTSIHELQSVGLPTTASLIADGVDSALGYDGTNLRWFDGTLWKTVTVT